MKVSSTQQFYQAKKYSLFMLLGSLVGLLASFILTIDKIKLLETPGFTPACSLNPIITCTAAMSSAQSETFGIPNSLMGIMFYTALVIISASVVLGTQYSKFILKTTLFAAIAGFLFANYLIIQSVLVLHVICPWCFTIWLSAPIVMLSAARIYAQKLAADTKIHQNRVTSFINRHLSELVLVWYVYLFVLLAVVFREYWATIL